jgi:uncharacterized damage-inducible protein DinB
MPHTADPLIAAGREILEQALSDMRGCIAGAPPQALNWQPTGDDTNSLAVLAMHSLHSTRSWLSVALGAPLPGRDRPSEFRATAEDVAALLATIDGIERDCVMLLDDAVAPDWAAAQQTHPRPAEDGPSHVAAAWAFLHALEHLREHVGQMLLTRQLWDAAQTA